MPTPHLLMKLDKRNMAKMSFKLPASDEWKSLILSKLAVYSPKVCKMFNFWQGEVVRICQSY
jgi:hypothetical protein